MIKHIILASIYLLGGVTLYASEKVKDNIHMFPQAKEGYVRHVVEVPKTDNDYAHKISLSIGKTMMVDCNHRALYGKVKEVSLKGWGYTYLEVDSIDEGVTTMMACSKPKTEQFVALQDELRRYNSRLPLVVYVPQGYEVRYHIWSADETEHKAIKR